MAIGTPGGVLDGKCRPRCFTLDRRDFSVYRHGKNRRLKIIPAPAH